MNADWTTSVRREYLGGNPRFDFPIRPLGWGRLFGVFLFGFGGLFIGLPGRTAWRSIHEWMAQGPDVGNVIFGLFPLIFVFAGTVPVALGLIILFGRCRVEWRDGQLIATELLGPFRWTRRLPRQPIRKLEVSLATSSTGNQAPKPVERFTGLAAEFADGSKRVVLWGYPRAWVLECAQELTGYLGGVSAGTHPVTVEVVETTPEQARDADVLQQPASSRVLVERSPGFLCCTIPPAGLWRGSKGLLFFGIFWCGFMTVFSGLMLKGGIPADGWRALGPLAFILLFWLIGIGLLTAAVHMGKRTATFTVAGPQFSIVNRGLFGTKQWELSRGEIAAIRADASGMEVNDRPVMELQIHPRTGKKIGLLAGRDEQEIRWLATELRHALQLGPRADTA